MTHTLSLIIASAGINHAEASAAPAAYLKRACDLPPITSESRRLKHRCAKLVSSGRWQLGTFNAFGLRK